MRIYLSGPMTGKPNYNRAAFNAEDYRLSLLGYTTWNPAHLPDGFPYLAYIAIDLLIMALGRFDVLSMLPGWQSSRGVRIERWAAWLLGMVIVEADKITSKGVIK